MAAAPHPYPWATLAQWRRHRVGRESDLNQDHDSSQHLRRLFLGSILVLAAALRCWRLDAAGFIVPYYFAGVRSMMGSWHNFFYNAFDPAGFVSLDKPPVAFWLQTASAKLLGFGTVSVLLPQVLAGLASIFVLYALVRRRFGTSAGLQRTETSGIRGRHRFGEENPGVRTVARARSLDGDRDAFCPRRVPECRNILHPGFLVEIGGKEPAGFVRQHRVYADSEIGRIAGCLSGKMRAENIVPERNECLV